MNDIAKPRRLDRIIDLRRRIHRVVDFIDENLDDSLSLDGLADIACISPFHFHRVYSRFVGQTPSETVRRLRLLRATDEIRVRDISVTQAALAAGYGSSQAFARAYRREFGRSPTQMRVMGLAAHDGRSAPMEFTIVERPPMDVDALAYDGMRGSADVLSVDAQAYAQLLGAGQRECMTLYFDDLMTPVDSRLRCALCFQANRRQSLPESLKLRRLKVPGGTYACIEQRGRLFDLSPLWPRFLSQTLPEHGWAIGSGPVIRLHVSDRAITPPSQRLAYLYVPVTQRLGGS